MNKRSPPSPTIKLYLGELIFSDKAFSEMSKINKSKAISYNMNYPNHNQLSYILNFKMEEIAL